MATWPHDPTVLSESEKKAYRHLLYHAMVDIRTLCQSRGRELTNPFAWRKQYRNSRIAGALADWLHNLAQHAATDFDGFDTDWFWVEYDNLIKRFNHIGPYLGAGYWMDYRDRYEKQLKRLHDTQ